MDKQGWGETIDNFQNLNCWLRDFLQILVICMWLQWLNQCQTKHTELCKYLHFSENNLVYNTSDHRINYCSQVETSWHYLKLGLGDDWAGHTRLTEESEDLCNVVTLSSEGNFGGELPTGSRTQCLTGMLWWWVVGNKKV